MYDFYRSEGGWLQAIPVTVEQALLSPDPDEAQAYLAEALTLAKPEHIIRQVVDAGEALAPLLREAIAAGIEPEFAREALRIIEADERRRRIAKGEVPPASALLTSRELEVLRLMADGLSNPQISRRLVVSLDTAKTHVHHILDKLEADSRTQAVTRARELDLL